MPADESPLIAFYLGTARDGHGRMLDEILAWTDERLEDVHNYIQWLFPLDEPSRFSPRAPILTPADIERFRSDPDLPLALRRSLVRFLAFLGLERSEEGEAVTIRKASAYQDRRNTWLYQGSHNYLRVTRVLKSLRLLGLEREAEALLACLKQVYHEQPRAIGEVTYAYWLEAGQRP